MSMISFVAGGRGAQIGSGVEGFPRGGVRGAQGGGGGGGVESGHSATKAEFEIADITRSTNDANAHYHYFTSFRKVRIAFRNWNSCTKPN
jgi:hypothetical protein